MLEIVGRKSFRVSIATACLAAALPAWPWGEFGHQVVGALAEDMLTPKAEAQVKVLLGPEGGGPTSLAAASTWADEIRTLRPATRPWHYITFQIDDAHPDVARADTPNAVTALDKEMAVLADPGADRYAREEALKWVVHLVGDLHQPLHAGEDHDKGGNLAQVKVNRRTYALHAVWDYVLLERLRLPVDSVKAMLEREIAADPAWLSRNAQGTPSRWAMETHALSPACYLLHGKRIPKGKKVQLDRDYVRAATLTSLAQLKRAGARLAFVLNRALDPGSGQPAARAPPGGAPGAAAYFTHADSLREGGDDDETASTPAVPKAGHAAKAKRGNTELARYAWSANSKVYHYSGCADVKRIRKKNLVTSDIPPPDKTLHQGCPRP
ncbi:MAG: S1/P1 nuclease [Fibrobacteres bacterium]|nr:S1/P1 nuclease [Fibrobacterota bacterium]